MAGKALQPRVDIVRIYALAALLLLGCLDLGGPERVDFSSEWHFNAETSQLGLRDLEGLEVAVLRIGHREPTFALRRTFVLGGQESHVSFELTADGVEREMQQGDRTLFSRLQWNGDALIFTARIPGNAGEAVNRVAYRLRDEGRVLKAEGRFQGPDMDYENLWGFDQQ